MIATLKYDSLSNYLDRLSGHVSALAYRDDLSASEIKGYQPGTSVDISAELSAFPLSGINRNEISGYATYSYLSGTEWLSAYPLSNVGGNAITAYLLCSDLSGRIGISTEADLSAYVMSHAKNIWIDDQISGDGPVQSDLSILKMTNDAFALSVLSGDILSNQLVVIDDDYIDAYGQPICALIMYDSEDDDVSMRGIAATDRYVDTRVSSVKGTLREFFLQVSATIAEKQTFEEISAGLLGSLSTVCEQL